MPEMKMCLKRGCLQLQDTIQPISLERFLVEGERLIGVFLDPETGQLYELQE